mmetsp:Transcript_107508/g.342646  ORF Transcript_107508/g.342646 Transcript_107508/m.342646 type:complete len:231 (-) Transcript_107508:157-849(-)
MSSAGRGTTVLTARAHLSPSHDGAVTSPLPPWQACSLQGGSGTLALGVGEGTTQPTTGLAGAGTSPERSLVLGIAPSSVARGRGASCPCSAQTRTSTCPPTPCGVKSMASSSSLQIDPPLLGDSSSNPHLRTQERPPCAAWQCSSCSVRRRALSATPHIPQGRGQSQGLSHCGFGLAGRMSIFIFRARIAASASAAALKRMMALACPTPRRPGMIFRPSTLPYLRNLCIS